MTPLQSLDAALKKSYPNSGIRLTAPEEIKAWSATIGDASAHITAILDDWSLVTIADHGVERIHLLGDLVGTTKVRTTSPVQRIDLREGFVITLSESVYQLGTRHEGEPELQQVIALAQAIGNWRQASGWPGFNYYH